MQNKPQHFQSTSEKWKSYSDPPLKLALSTGHSIYIYTYETIYIYIKYKRDLEITPWTKKSTFFHPSHTIHAKIEIFIIWLATDWTTLDNVISTFPVVHELRDLLYWESTQCLSTSLFFLLFHRTETFTPTSFSIHVSKITITSIFGFRQERYCSISWNEAPDLSGSVRHHPGASESKNSLLCLLQPLPWNNNFCPNQIYH